MRIIALSINTAARAGCLIRDIMAKGQLNIVDKVVNIFRSNRQVSFSHTYLFQPKLEGIQTEADRTSQKSIIASLVKEFPGVCVIGEEGEEKDLNVPPEWLETEQNSDFLANHKCPDKLANVTEDQVVIWVDPLDGTLEFAENKVENTTVLIGVAVNDEAVAGVIHQPYFKSDGEEQLGRTIWGVKGLGMGGMVAKQPPENEFTVVTTRSHSNQLVQDAITALNPSKVIRCGGAGYKVLQLLEGNAHGYVFASPGCKRWDTCAPEAVLEAAGGVLTNMQGEHYNYAKTQDYTNKSGVLATAVGVNFEEVLQKIPDSVKNSLK